MNVYLIVGLLGVFLSFASATDSYFGGWEACVQNMPNVENTGMEGWDSLRTPILSVPDFNGDGRVTAHDVKLMRARMVAFSADASIGYEAFFDLDGDCDIDDGDLNIVLNSMGMRSNSYDRRVAQLFALYDWVGDLRGDSAFYQNGIFPIPVPLRGHGNHWFTPKGLAVMQGYTAPNMNEIEGLNIPSNEGSSNSRVHGLFWPGYAVPIFRDPESGLEGIFDFPPSPFFDVTSLNLGVRLPACYHPHYGGGDPDCLWANYPVVRFANPSPQLSGDSVCEAWHAHAGLCMFVNDATGLTEAHQHTTLNECLQMSDERGSPSPPWMGMTVPVPLPNGDVYNVQFGSTLWLNTWMVHFWLFDLNPLGLYAGWHPTLNLNAPSEASLNNFAVNTQGRPVTQFFLSNQGETDACCRAEGKHVNACCQHDDWRNNMCCRCTFDHSSCPSGWTVNACD